MNPFEQQRVAQLTYDGGQRSKVSRKIDRSGKDLGEPQKRVFLSLVKERPTHNGTARKDIFSDNKQVGSTGNATPKPAAQPARDDLQRARPATPRQRILDAWNRFTVFGFFQSKNDMVLFLERGKEIITIRQGEKFDGRFEIVELTKEGVILKDTTSGQTAEVSLADL